MSRRVLLSVFKNKTRNIVFGLVFFAIATVMLSSLSIISATDTTMEQAYNELDPTVSLGTDEAIIFETLMAEGYTRKEIKDMWEDYAPILTSDMVSDIGDSIYVTDYNYTITGSAVGVDFNGFDQTGEINTERLTVSNLTGTFNPEMVSELNSYNIIQGTMFDGSNTGVAVIAEAIAEENDLTIGDIITLGEFEMIYVFEHPTLEDVIATYDDEQNIILPDTVTDTVGWTEKESYRQVISGTEMELEIIGTYESSSNFKNPQGLNNILVSMDDMLNFLGYSDENPYTVSSVTFFLDNIENTDSFYEEQSVLSYIEDGSFMFTGNEATYEAMVEPLSNVSEFTNLILVIVILSGVLVISLIIANSLKDRKYEIGVLLSLGESKIKLSLQFMFEMLIVGTIAFTLAIVSANIISDDVGSKLLNNQTVSAAEETETGTQPGDGTGARGTNSTINVPVIDEMSVKVDFNQILIMYLLGSGIIMISSVLPSLYISRYQPKKILSSGN